MKAGKSKFICNKRVQENSGVKTNIPDLSIVLRDKIG